MSLSAISLMFAGIALGIFKYRLFDLDRWWFRTWTWLIGGALVVAADLLLVSVFGVGELEGTMIALAVFVDLSRVEDRYADEALESEVTDTIAWAEIGPRSTRFDDPGDRSFFDLQVECLDAGPGSLEVRLDGIRADGEVLERKRQTVALQCDPAGGTTSASTTGTTTVTPDTDADTGTDGDTDDDTGTTGGGPLVELVPGTYLGTTSAEQLIIFGGLGSWFAACPASAFGLLIDLTNDIVIEEVGSSESAAFGDPSGTKAKAPNPTVFFGFPGLRYATYDGDTVPSGRATSRPRCRCSAPTSRTSSVPPTASELRRCAPCSSAPGPSASSGGRRRRRRPW